MKNTLVVVTDLGGFKAFRLDDDRLNSTPRLQLLEEFSNREAQLRMVEQVTDLAGRFPRNTGIANSSTAMSHGERHNIELEKRKRGVRRLATRLNTLVRDARIERWYLAVSREINHPLMEELEPRVRAKIEKLVPVNLSKVNKSELLQHFQA